MKLSFRNKLTFSFLFLFINLTLVGGLGYYYIRQLSEETKNILKDNYRSVGYMQAILEASETVRRYPLAAEEGYAILEKNISLQEANLTEPGEKELTAELANHIRTLKSDTSSTKSSSSSVNVSALNILQLNLDAINRKSEQAQKTAGRAWLGIAGATTVSLLVCFSFILNMPSYLSRPLREIKEGIEGITEKNFGKRVKVVSSDEFGSIAAAFNLMAEKTESYFHSNLTDLLNEKKRTDTLMDLMSDPMITTDENKNILFVNRAAAEVLGTAKETLVGQYAPDAALKIDLLHQWLGCDETKESNIIAVADGRERRYLCSIREIKNMRVNEFKEKVIGFVLILRDYTLFSDRDAAKTQFIASVSHELRTPISSLEMAHRLLTDRRTGNLNKEQKIIICQIEKDVVRLKNVTRELLDLAQVETGNIKLINRKTSVEEILSFAVESMRLQAKEKNILLQTDYDKNLPDLNADPEKCAWVVTNLLSNAIRYTPEGGNIQVKVNKKDNFVKFYVIDNGKGIPEQYLKRLFEKYFQVPGSDPNKKGTGLGLAIAKEFIEAQGGVIECESKVGYGSIFSFTLPIWGM